MNLEISRETGLQSMGIFRFLGNIASGAALIIAVSAALLPQRAIAQDDSGLEGPDLFLLEDENGVSLNGQTIRLPILSFSVGEGATATDLALWYRSGQKSGIFDNFLTSVKRIGRNQDPCTSQDYQITLYGSASLYEWSSNSPFYTVSGNGDFLEFTNGDQQLTHTSSEGDVTLFNRVNVATRKCLYIPEKTTKRNGLILKYYLENYGSIEYPSYRMKTVETNGGIQVRFTYSNSGSNGRTQGIQLINSSIERCDPLASFCNFTNQWPTFVFGDTRPDYCVAAPCPVYDANSAVMITSPDGSWARLRFVRQGSIDQIEYSGRAPINIAMSGEGQVSSVNNGGLITTYQYFRLTTSGGACLNNVVRTNPDGSQEKFYLSGPSSLDAGMVCKHTDTLGRTTILNPVNIYDEYRYESVVKPEGNRAQYSYDDRANVTQVSLTPKVGSGDNVITTSAVYPSSCINRKTCNQPSSVTDARGNTSSYTYDPTHGGVLTMTGPAVGGVSPVTRYYYVQREAWLRSGAGYAKTGEPIWLKSEERSCRTSTLDTVAGTCSAGAGDLVRTLYDYGPDSGPNNLWLRGIALEADGQTLRTCFQNDQLGRRIAETKPLGTGATCP